LVARFSVIKIECKHESARRAAIERRIAEGLLKRSDDYLRLTRPGLMLANTVLEDLI
jgi:coproporphyrinogen III oxidase-like Fe-S oxidoreductase